MNRRVHRVIASTTILLITATLTTGCLGGHLVAVNPQLLPTPAGTASSLTPPPVSHISQNAGFGDAPSWIAQRWGSPTSVRKPMSRDGSGDMTYHKAIRVQYDNGYAFNIEESFVRPITLSTAKLRTRGMLPLDARFDHVAGLSSQTHTLELDYVSAAVEHRWSSSFFPLQPGSFHVTYKETSQGLVEGVAIATSWSSY